MSGFLEREAVAVSPPATGGTISLTSASSTAGSGNLTAYQGAWLLMKADTKTHVRFGTSTVGAATTGDIYLTADADYSFRIPRDGTLTHVRARTATGSGKLYFRKTSGPL